MSDAATPPDATPEQRRGMTAAILAQCCGTLGLTATVKVFRYNLALDREELVEELTHVFSTIDPWLVGEYTF